LKRPPGAGGNAVEIKRFHEKKETKNKKINKGGASAGAERRGGGQSISMTMTMIVPMKPCATSK
jgi:hypothetical protein